MSIDIKMAWRNIWRNPRRTIITISAIAFACLLLIFMLSFQFGSYETMINSSVKIHAGHLQVQAKEYQDKQNIRMVVPNPEETGRILDKVLNIDSYTFRAKAFSLVSSKNRTYGVMVIGIDPSREKKVSTIKNSIRQGSYLSKKDKNQAIVGKLLANNLGVIPGDELTIMGQGRDGSIAATVVSVKGIYASGLDEFDRSSIQIPLTTFQEVYTMGKAVHEVVVIGNSLRNISKIKENVQNQIKKTKEDDSLTVLNWEELMPGLRQGIEMDLTMGIIFYLLLIIVVAFSILNTFLMAIFERTKEFGVLMAIGTTPGRITKLLLIESISLTMVGIVAGIFIGCLLTLIFQYYGVDLSGASELLAQYGISGIIYPKLSLLSALGGPLAVFLITFLAALYPALKIRKLQPVEAMMHV